LSHRKPGNIDAIGSIDLAESMECHRLQPVAQTFLSVRAPSPAACGLSHRNPGSIDVLASINLGETASGTGESSPVC